MTMKSFTQPQFTHYEVTFSRAISRSMVVNAVTANWPEVVLTVSATNIGLYTHTTTVAPNVATPPILQVHSSTSTDVLVRLVGVGRNAASVAKWVQDTFLGDFHVSRVTVSMISHTVGMFDMATEMCTKHFGDVWGMPTLTTFRAHQQLTYQKKSPKPAIVSIAVKGVSLEAELDDPIGERRPLTTIAVTTQPKEPWVKKELAHLTAWDVLRGIEDARFIVDTFLHSKPFAPDHQWLVNTTVRNVPSKPHPLVSMVVSYEKHLMDAAESSNWRSIGELLEAVVEGLRRGDDRMTLSNLVVDTLDNAD